MPVKDPLGNHCSWRVGLHLRSLGMPRVPELTALRNAQACYGPHGILIEFVSGQSLPDGVHTQNQCLQLQDVDVGTCTLRQAMTGQQAALFGHGSFQGVRGTDILVYWVDRVRTVGGHLAGCASHPLGRPACVVAAAGSPWTMAHEVGHVLGLRHRAGTRNLMSTPTASISANPPQLSASEVATVRTSPYCSGV